MNNLSLSEFEAAIFEKIISETKDFALRAQLTDIQVSSREHTGSGCVSKLKVAEDAPVIREAYGLRGPLFGPDFESSAAEDGGGTLLWFKEGRVDQLEIFANGDYFPSDHKEILSFKFLGKREV